MAVYTKTNYLLFLFSTFSSISFAVFLVSSQPFLIKYVANYGGNLGKAVGDLGFYDEIVAIGLGPFVGTASDYTGTRPVAVLGFVCIGIALMGVTTVIHGSDGWVFFQLFLWRLVFAAGFCATLLMITAMLTELTASGFRPQEAFKRGSTVEYEYNPLVEDLDRLGSPLEFDDLEDELAAEQAAAEQTTRPQPANPQAGYNAALTGIWAGLGAIFAVLVYLPLPLLLSGLEDATALLVGKAFWIVGVVSLVTAGVLYKGLFKRGSGFTLLRILLGEELARSTVTGYIARLKCGFRLGYDNPRIALAYCGLFVARASNVCLLTFIPLMVYQYYHDVTGECSAVPDHNNMKQVCRPAFTLAAILVGVSLLVGVLVAPLWGIVNDRVTTTTRAILAAAILGVWGALGLGIAPSSLLPAGFLRMFHIVMVGVGQSGMSVLSMTLVTDQDRLFKGAVAGVYALVGGVGIMFLTKVGGLMADAWVGAVFTLLAVVYGGVFGGALYTEAKYRSGGEVEPEDVV